MDICFFDRTVLVSITKKIVALEIIFIMLYTKPPITVHITNERNLFDINSKHLSKILMLIAKKFLILLW